MCLSEGGASHTGVDELSSPGVLKHQVYSSKFASIIEQERLLKRKLRPSSLSLHVEPRPFEIPSYISQFGTSFLLFLLEHSARSLSRHQSRRKEKKFLITQARSFRPSSSSDASPSNSVSAEKAAKEGVRKPNFGLPRK